METPIHAGVPDIAVRRFIPLDAEGITALIRRNYGETYHKTPFYDPEAIRNANDAATIISVVALYFETVIGHFALFPSDVSAVGEIGAAVVDPAFKQLGIMNRMFDLLVSIAQERNLAALYGEAIMLHPFSQRANLRHGMTESALLLGEVPASIEIEHRYKDPMRSGGLEAFLLFDKTPRALRLPERYTGIITETYRHAGISLLPIAPALPEHDETILPRYNPFLQIGYLVFEGVPDEPLFEKAMEDLRVRRCDMIYADINLHRIEAIDALIGFLNARRFFYAGVMFALYGEEDYLRLQFKNTPHVDEHHLVCYSPFARELLAYILEDERRVMENPL